VLSSSRSGRIRQWPSASWLPWPRRSSEAVGRPNSMNYDDDDYNDDYDDDDDGYPTCPYNLVVHPPALAICVHRVAPAGFPAGPVNRLQLVSARRPIIFSQKANPLHVYPEVVYLSGGLLRSDLCDCRSICCRGGVSQRSSSPL
jgi:hypothetical protein